ncbi:hypothetical protein A8L34_11725 [Bacillus sp. FJAT-27264]|uniref:hypothetical protein n=1 Tax=Paenibacillus sp. (strain DSM 101736 / FJAT-27264) TaxID=1850362 RepID=UPI000808090C|nr:hypothetical protein [Bacillus sp. FJAT-27264]OBZ14587.1 hypothetical protein A8L34_11725 [Bacillus sp. FJAT-27264]
MKWVSLIITVLSVLALGGIYGFSLFIVITGIIGGLIASFAIAGYLKSVNGDFPGDRYEDGDIKY